MTRKASSLNDVKITNEQQEIIDAANNGNMGPLLRYLNGALRAVCKLSLEQVGYTAASRLGLRSYYNNCMVSVISGISDAKKRKALETIYLGE